MKFNFLKYIKSLSDKFKVDRREVLQDVGKEISNQILHDSGFDSEEIGFLIFEINRNIKNSLLIRKENLEKDLSQTTKSINLIH